MMDAEMVAKGLSEAQKRALIKFIDKGNDPYGRPWTTFSETKRTADELVAKGLLISGRVYDGYLGYRFTESATAVRAHLKGE